MSQTAVKEYTVILERGENNWSAYVPDLPGCIATGKTREATLHRMREAMSFHIDGMRLNGEAIPDPSTESDRVAVTVSTGD